MAKGTSLFQWILKKNLRCRADIIHTKQEKHYGISKRKNGKHMNLLDMQANAGQATVLLKALANKHRLLLLCLLNDKELSVGELNAVLKLPQSTLSQHLAVLRKDGLVATRRDAQTIHYSLASFEVKEIIATLYRLYCA